MNALIGIIVVMLWLHFTSISSSNLFYFNKSLRSSSTNSHNLTPREPCKKFILRLTDRWAFVVIILWRFISNNCICDMFKLFIKVRPLKLIKWNWMLFFLSTIWLREESEFSVTFPDFSYKVKYQKQQGDHFHGSRLLNHSVTSLWHTFISLTEFFYELAVCYIW